MINATGLGGMYGMLKGGVGIADKVVKGGERIRGGENPFSVGRDMIPEVLPESWQPKAREALYYGQDLFNECKELYGAYDKWDEGGRGSVKRSAVQRDNRPRRR
jgi:hypothetical protein